LQTAFTKLLSAKHPVALASMADPSGADVIVA
jgi:hypothetical protein